VTEANASGPPELVVSVPSTEPVGVGPGLPLGCGLGEPLGKSLGELLGELLGESLGAPLGSMVGGALGSRVGGAEPPELLGLGDGLGVGSARATPAVMVVRASAVATASRLERNKGFIEPQR